MLGRAATKVTDACRDFPPHDLAAERAVLGSMMLSGEAMNLARERLSEADFYDPRHQILFRALSFMDENNRAVDTLTLTRALEEQRWTKQAGGPEYHESLLADTPSAANVAHYINVVVEEAGRRGLLDSARVLERECFDRSKPVDMVTDGVITALERLHRTRDEEHPTISVADAAINEEGLHGVKAADVKTHIAGLDDAIHGLLPGDYVVILGFPSNGKTDLMLNICRNAHLLSDAGVMIFSLETTVPKVLMRLACSIAQVNSHHIAYEKDKMRKAYEMMSRWERFGIVDKSSITVSEIRARAKRWKRRHGLDIIAVDYLQLLEPPEVRDVNRERQIAGSSRQLKALAKDLECTVIVLAQPKERDDGKVGRRPEVGRIKESRAVHDHAEKELIVWYPYHYTQTMGIEQASMPGSLKNLSPSEYETRLEVTIGKNKDGPVGGRSLTYIAAEHQVSDRIITIGFEEEPDEEDPGFTEDVPF